MVNNKESLYSTRNYTQYLVITYNEKESEEYIYSLESFNTLETNTTL